MQTCQNTVGSYTCNCTAGYVLNGDGRTCDGEFTTLQFSRNNDFLYHLQMLMSACSAQTSAPRIARTPSARTLAAVQLGID